MSYNMYDNQKRERYNIEISPFWKPQLQDNPVASPGRARESPVPGHHQRRAVGCRSSHTSKANPPPHAKMTELGSCKLG